LRATETGVFDSQDGGVGEARKVLYWIAMCLRLVNRKMYIACMHVLRSTYLPSYASFVRPPYSSDPFPMASSSTTSDSPLNSIQRETAVLDLFVAAKVREDVWLDDTELHLEREETFKDLFDLNQPRARLEDLVRFYGSQSGMIASYPTSSTPTSPSSSRVQKSIPFSSLSISFSPRRVALLQSSTSYSGRKYTLAEVERARDEKLEIVARKLVRTLERERERKGLAVG